MVKRSSKPVVMTLAGHDPVGGAGIQADIESITAANCHATAVISCLTVQDTHNVYRLQPVDAELFYQQAKTVLDDVPIRVFKIGLLAYEPIVEKLVQLLDEYPDIPVVYDPVLAAGGGCDLSTKAFISKIKTQLLPKVSVLTPNLPEALRLLGRELVTKQAMTDHGLSMIAAELSNLGCDYILLTGTHNPTDQVQNTLYYKGACIDQGVWQRLPHEYHGSGCTLASSIAAHLALGKDMQEAVTDAQAFTWQSLQKGFVIGKGQRIPDR